MGTVRTRRLRDILETLVVSRQFQGSATIGYLVPIRQPGYAKRPPCPGVAIPLAFPGFSLVIYISFSTNHRIPVVSLPPITWGAGSLMHVSPCLAIAGFLSAAPRPNLFANPLPPVGFIFAASFLPY
ncbi:hypothetical protein EDB80DRAFT_728203 [Ilyonectria destructans]|nr:hypothetical protein EDB80DRAFT_728203 [Ilyonectria destructans]